jgi:hypothetical protein
LPKNEDVGVDLPPRILKSNEWMARWQEQEESDEKFQHNRVSKRKGEERMRGRVPFIPLEAKGSGLDQCQVLV